MKTPTFSDLRSALDDQSPGIEAGQAVFHQERFNGVLPQRNERPAADLFRERLLETNPDSLPGLFIP